MKTLTNLAFTLLLVSISLVTNVAQGQSDSGKVWVTFLDVASVPQTNESSLYSANPEIQRLITDFHVYSVEQAVPSSRNPDLQKLYEIECHCKWDELAEAMEKVGALSAPVRGPEYELLYDPNDYTTVFTNDYALDLINAKTAWDFTTGDTTVIIGISDGNFYTNHEELLGKVAINAALPGGSVQFYHHGTAVAITAAGGTDNATGKSSIGFNSKLALANIGYNQLLNLSYSGSRVINVSWASGCWSNNYIQTIIDEVYTNGTIVVAAAGNGSTCGGPTNLVYPAACDHVIAVSSVGPQNNHERTIGNPTTTHQHNSSVDLCAPGYDVDLTVSPGFYLTGNGTSFASPYVAGTIGLMLAVRPCLTYEEALYILQSTAFNLDALNPNYVGGLGAGRMDAGLALEMTLALMPSIAVDISDVSCFGLNDGTIALTQLNGVGSVQTAWSTGTNTLQNTTSQTYSNLSGGNYNLTITDSSGCVFDTSFVVSEPDELILNTVVSTYASGTNISCAGSEDGSIDLTISNGAMPLSFDWNSTTGTGLIAGQEDQANLSSGLYTVVITDSNNCQTTANYTLTAPDSLEVDYVTSVFPSGSNISCFGENDGAINLTVNGGNGPYQYEWNSSSNAAITQGQANQSGLYTGNYAVLISDLNGCSDSLQFQLTEPSLLLVDLQVLTDYFGNAVSCEGNNDGAIAATILGGSPDYDLQWNTLSNGIGDTLTDVSAGEYTIIVTDANACVTENSVVLEANPLPIIQPDAQIETCLGSTVMLSANTAENETSRWQLSNGLIFTANGSFEIVMNQVGCLHASLTVTNQYGCSNAAFIEDYICTYSLPEAQMLANTYEISPLENEIGFVNASSGASAYEWYFGDNETSFDVDPTHTFNVDEFTEGFDVTLYAFNDHGCYDSTSTHISINDDLMLYVPNTFTPDGNEFNNTFKPVYGSQYEPTEYSLQVFNRWGELVFESKDIAYGWDGTFKSSFAPEGTYVWKIILSTDDRIAADSNKNILHGHVNLIR